MKWPQCLVTGAIGAIVVIFIGVIIYAWIAPIDVAPVYMLNPNCLTDSIYSAQLDSIKCAHIEILSDLEDKGVLLHPAEYTSHIADFYSSLIAFLIGLFVIFSLGGIYVMRATNRQEIDELKQDIKNDMQNQILSQLSTLLNDSISFKETTISALYGRIEDEIVTTDKLVAIESSIEKLQSDIQLLYDSVNEIEENIAANETIQDDK